MAVSCKSVRPLLCVFEAPWKTYGLMGCGVLDDGMWRDGSGDGWICGDGRLRYTGQFDSFKHEHLLRRVLCYERWESEQARRVKVCPI